MPEWLIPFIVVDLVVMAVIVYLFVSRRVRFTMDVSGGASGVDFNALMAFTREKHARIGEYVRANWSGAPDQLPHVLETLMAELERDAQSRGLAVDRDLLKSVLASSIRSHRVVKSRDLGEAMKRVA